MYPSYTLRAPVPTSANIVSFEYLPSLEAHKCSHTCQKSGRRVLYAFEIEVSKNKSQGHYFLLKTREGGPSQDSSSLNDVSL